MPIEWNTSHNNNETLISPFIGLENMKKNEIFGFLNLRGARAGYEIKIISANNLRESFEFLKVKRKKEFDERKKALGGKKKIQNQERNLSDDNYRNQDDDMTIHLDNKEKNK